MLIEIVYALPEQQVLLSLQVPHDTTVLQAIQLSGMLKRFPEIDLNKHSVGIFSQKVGLDHLLQEGDRIEIYRPLIIDPKAARRVRAAKKPSN